MLKLGFSEDLLSESSHLDRVFDIGSHLDLVYETPRKLISKSSHLVRAYKTLRKYIFQELPLRLHAWNS